jgi:hypothetical protein
MKERIKKVIELSDTKGELFEGIALEFFTFGEDKAINKAHLSDIRSFVNNALAENNISTDLSSITDEEIICYLL